MAGPHEAENNDDTDEVEVPVDNTARYMGDFYPDPGHDFDDVTMQLYGTGTPGPGAIPDMSGFARSYAKRCNGDVPASHRIMKCFDPARLPMLTTLAQQYAVCDHWFSSLPDPTLPNRLFAHAGTSGGRLDMAPEDFSGFNTIHEVLDKADVSSTIYADGWSGVATIPYLLKFQTQFFDTCDDFNQGCKRGKLSSYTFIEPRYVTALDSGGVLRPQNHQHPDSDVAEGENLICSGIAITAFAQNLMGFQAELRHQVWGPLGLFGFYDVGRVAMRTSDLGLIIFITPSVWVCMFRPPTSSCFACPLDSARAREFC